MIRQIDVALVHKLAEVKTAAFNGPPWNDCWTLPSAEKSLRQSFGNNGFYGLYIEDAGQVAGYVHGRLELFCDGVHFYMQELCIAPEFQRRRFGAMLLEELKQRLREKGVVKVSLITGNNPSILDFYCNNGFKPLMDVTILDTEIS